MNRFPCLVTVLALGGMSAAFAQTPAKSPAPAAQPAPSAEAVFAAWDADKDKSLSLEEFRAGTDRMARVAAVQRLKGHFDRQDRNHDGALDAGEYATLPVVKQAGAAAPLLANADADKSGRVEFREYVAMVATLAKSPGPRQ